LIGSGTGTGAASAGRVGDARRALAGQLRERAIDTPDLDARLLVGHALGLDHTALATAATRALTPDENARIEALLVRRLGGEPIARILGVKEFWGLRLALSPAVLVPRPETETVVEQALAAILQDGPRSRALRIADLGAGSGAIMLALLSELPNAFAVGTDRDPAALALARCNACRLGLAARAAFVACDFGAALAGGFDVVVTNPPYLGSEEIAELPAEVRDFDPCLALDGGADGLEAYRVIAADAFRLLAPKGRLFAEIGKDQDAQVAALFAAAGLRGIEVAPDLAGIPRVVFATGGHNDNADHGPGAKRGPRKKKQKPLG
jgi:release factor glutamine methyltransferase